MKPVKRVKMSDSSDERLEDEECRSFSPDAEETDECEEASPPRAATLQKLIEDDSLWLQKGKPLPLSPYQPSGKWLAKRRFDPEYQFVDREGNGSCVVVYDPDQPDLFQSIQVSADRFLPLQDKDKKGRRKIGCVRSLVEIYADQTNKDNRGNMCRKVMILNERLRQMGTSRPVDGGRLRKLLSGQSYRPLLKKPVNYLLGVMDAFFAMYSIGRLSREKADLIQELMEGSDHLTEVCERIVKRVKRKKKV